MKSSILFSFIAIFFCTACVPEPTTETRTLKKETDSLKQYAAEQLKLYGKTPLTTNLNFLSSADRKMLPLLIEAAQTIDELFWKQTYPEKDSLLAAIRDEKTRSLVLINYGPWDRLNNYKPFVSGVSNHATDTLSANLNSVRHEKELHKVASLLQEAASAAENPLQKKYLNVLSESLISNNYPSSNKLSTSLQDFTLHIFIKPTKISDTETGHGAIVLLKDQAWSDIYSNYTATATIGKNIRTKKTNSIDLYNVVYYAGAANLFPENASLKKTQQKNTLEATFNKKIVPVATAMISPDQHVNIKFEAFYARILFPELIFKNVPDKLSLNDVYVTYLADIFHSIYRGDIKSLPIFNLLMDKGAVVRNETGFYSINFDRFGAAIAEMKTGVFADERKMPSKQLLDDLKRLKKKRIPVHIVFDQGFDVLGMK